MELSIQAMAINAEIAACQSYDKSHDDGGYTEEVYLQYAARLNKIADEIFSISKSGWLI